VLRGADCLLSCPPHFRSLAARWRQAGDDPRHIAVKVAQRLCRILYQIVARQQVFCHPEYNDRHYILDKLIAFHGDHDTPPATLQCDLEAAATQRPPAARAAEAAPLRERLKAHGSGRARDPQDLAHLVPKVLARLGVQAVQSKKSEALGPR
jgi:hypothetical protein